MCTESFNLLRSKSGPHFWEQSYYNKQNGGILNHPQGWALILFVIVALKLFLVVCCLNVSDFFIDEQAKLDYKNRLRYLVARYSYSTSVFAWEYFNEVCHTDDEMLHVSYSQ